MKKIFLTLFLAASINSSEDMQIPKSGAKIFSKNAKASLNRLIRLNLEHKKINDLANKWANRIILGFPIACFVAVWCATNPPRRH